MERFIYINGVFFDRVSNTAEEIAESLHGEIALVEPYNHPVCGPSERVYLTRTYNSDSILRGYLEAVLWTGTNSDDEPLDYKYGVSDIAEASIDTARSEIEAFMKASKHLFSEDELSDPDSIGLDLHLTRNRHGSGFWDGGYKKGKELTEIAHKMGEVLAYACDDGKVYIDSQFRGL